MREVPATGSNFIISKTKNIFSKFFAVLESAQKFGHFTKTDQLHSLNILEFIDPEKCSYFSARRLLFYNILQSQRVHGSQTLLKPTLKKFCSNFL